MKPFSIVLLFLLLPSAIYSQECKISGFVAGKDSSNITGATIVIKGTTLGTVTDKSGFYEITRLKAGTYTMRISFLGYETQEKTISVTRGNTRLDFVMMESDLDLNEVVVTGTKSEKPLKNVPVVTQVISAAKMLDLGITNVTEALQTAVPGLSMSQFGTRASVTLQGMDSKYVLFLVDGERIAGAVNGDIDYSMLNLENVDRIEVIKGASSSLYGSNAIGGVINIITKKITDPFDGKIYSRYSRNNELFSGGTVGLKRGIIGSRTSFNYSRTDGYDLTPESNHDWTQNPYNSINLKQKFEITPGPHLSITPYLGYYQFERGNVSARPAHDFYSDLNSGIKALYYAGKNSLTVSYYRDRYNTYNVLEQIHNQKDLVAYDIIETLRLQGNIQISERNNLIAGAEYNTENIFSQRIDGNKKGENEAVLYAQEDIRMGEKLFLIAGVRASYHSSYGLHFAPKISLLLKQGSFNFRTSAGTGFRSPELKELYMNFDHFGEWYIVGNTDLKPESSRYVSGSVEFSKPWNNTSFTAYSNKLSNMITDRWLPDTVRLTRQYQNVASASVYGFDLISKQKLINNFWVNAGYSYVHSTDNQSGLQLYGTAKHSGNVSADYIFRKKEYSLTTQLYCKIMGEKFYEVTDQGASFDKPYTTWRLTITQEFKWLRFSTGVDNIFNVIMPENLDLISLGRCFFVGINIDFSKLR